MRYSEKAGYAAIDEVIGEPLAGFDGVESILEGLCVALADAGCAIAFPGNMAEYREYIARRWI